MFAERIETPLGAMLAVADDKGLRLLEFADRRALESELSTLRQRLKTQSTFAKAASNVTGVQWPPFMTEALNQSATAFAGVLNGSQTLPAAFRAFQDKLVNYAKQQGFQVSTSF